MASHQCVAAHRPIGPVTTDRWSGYAICSMICSGVPAFITIKYINANLLV